MPLRTYLAAIAIFCNEVKGKSALALSRDLDCQYKTAFVLAHKMREAMASEMKGKMVGGVGKVVETDGAYFGGCVKPANMKENRRDRRLACNQTGKRQVVVVVRERDGRTLPAVFRSESAALGFITSRVAKGTKLMADEAGSWNDLHARFDVARIDHGQIYSLQGGVYTNGAEEFFSRMRRAEIGHHHHIAGTYLIRYAQESAWREDHRRVDNGRQTQAVMGLAMRTGPQWPGAATGSDRRLDYYGPECTRPCLYNFARSVVAFRKMSIVLISPYRSATESAAPNIASGSTPAFIRPSTTSEYPALAAARSAASARVSSKVIAIYLLRWVIVTTRLAFGNNISRERKAGTIIADPFLFQVGRQDISAEAPDFHDVEANHLLSLKPPPCLLFRRQRRVRVDLAKINHDTVHLVPDSRDHLTGHIFCQGVTRVSTICNPLRGD
jgi:hypothetical protein